MANTIIESLIKALPEEQVKEVSAAIEQMVAEGVNEVKATLETEHNAKLQEAYAQVEKELNDGEAIAEEGYQQAYSIIQDLRNRLETQRAEFDKFMEEQYEEAFQQIKSEQSKRESVETDLYGEYDKKLNEMKDFMIDKLDQFLQLKGKEMYEEARRDVINDPRLVEHKVALQKIVDTVSDYISDEDFAAVSSSKLQEAQKSIEDIKGQMKILEARNIRISTENTRLNEAARHTQAVLNEQAKTQVVNEQNETIKKAAKVEGRGKKVVDTVEVIGEHKTETNTTVTENVVENLSAEEIEQFRVLSGIGDKK